MKRIFRDTCILAALMILSVFSVSIIWVGMTDEIRLVIRLFGLSFIIALVNYFLDEYTSLVLSQAGSIRAISGWRSSMWELFWCWLILLTS